MAVLSHTVSEANANDCKFDVFQREISYSLYSTHFHICYSYYYRIAESNHYLLPVFCKTAFNFRMHPLKQVSITFFPTWVYLAYSLNFVRTFYFFLLCFFFERTSKHRNSVLISKTKALIAIIVIARRLIIMTVSLENK